MSDENKQVQTAPESGGIVTTVRTETTSDLDVKRILDEQAEEQAAAAAAAGGDKQDEPPATVVDDKNKKAGEPKADTAKPKIDDEDGPIDFDKLTPAERKLVNRAYKDSRVQGRKTIREQNERISALEQELAGRPKGTTEAPPQPKPKELPKPVRPRRGNFSEGKEGDDKFEAEMDKFQDADYAYRKAVEDQAAASKKQADEDKATVDNFNALADQFAEDHPDYEEVMDSDVPITAVMFGYMLEEGPALGYYFGTHRDEAEKISKMPQRKQEKAIMRIITKMEDQAEADRKAKGGTKTETSTVTPKEKKPEPPKPVAARGSQTVAKDPSKMTFKEREQEFARTHPGQLNYIP